MNDTKQYTARLRYLHIAPRKVRLVADTLKGLSANEAEAQLLMRPQRSARPLLKLLQSAVANARHNQKLEPERLVISSLRVDQGPMLKRILPRAQGRATPIQKKMSHVTIVLEERDVHPSRFTIIPPPKKKTKSGEQRKKTKKPQPKKEEFTETKERRGFLKRVFRRKSV
jgi:large subunit ribosomal protein L22